MCGWYVESLARLYSRMCRELNNEVIRGMIRGEVLRGGLSVRVSGVAIACLGGWLDKRGVNYGVVL